MPTTPGGTVLQPIVTSAEAVCKAGLLTKEDLFLLYAEYFFPYDINPAGFHHVYGVHDPTAGDTPDMCMSIDDRQAMMRSLWLTYQRMASSLRYYPLPTYVDGERHAMHYSSAMKMRKGYLTHVGTRSCSLVERSVPLMEADDGLWEAEVDMPATGSINDLVAYESGVRNVRVPIAERSLSDDGLTVTLRFYRPTLVSAVTWAACGDGNNARSSCDCPIERSDSTAYLAAIDVFSMPSISTSGMSLTMDCACSPSSSSACGIIEDPVLGWVRSNSNVTVCTCTRTSASYGTVYYTSGRWTRDSIPEDVQEALFGTAISLMPTAGLCQEATRPAHMLLYRELVPTDAPGGMRPWGQALMRAVVRTYANGSGI